MRYYMRYYCLFVSHLVGLKQNYCIDINLRTSETLKIKSIDYEIMARYAHRVSGTFCRHIRDRGSGLFNPLFKSHDFTHTRRKKKIGVGPQQALEGRS